MLSGVAHTFRQKSRLAISLAWVGGFVDSVGIIEIGRYVSNMTGNTASIAQLLAEWNWRAGLDVSLLVLMFLAGAMLSGLVIESSRRRHMGSIYARCLVIEVILLLAFVGAVHTDVGMPMLMVAMLPCLAMGLQNATITQVAGSVVRTTHVTGVLTDLGIESVQFAYWMRDRTRGRWVARLRRAFRLSPRHPSLQRLALLLSIWVSFLMGAALGAMGYVQWGAEAALAPVLFLLTIIAIDLLRPIAVVRNVDFHSAPMPQRFASPAHAEPSGHSLLVSFGIDPTLLPSNVRVMRVERVHQRSGAPDLSNLANRLQRRDRVLVLMVPDDVRLDDNSLIGLQQSLSELRRERRSLVLCVHRPEHYHRVRAHPVGQDLGPVNLCSDIEFAIARAIELSEHT